MKMIKKDLDRFKKILLKKREDILKEIKVVEKDSLKRSQRDASGDLSAYTFHMADVATDNYDREFSLGVATNVQQNILYAIDEALKRIEDKSYGVCVKCDKPISRQRLSAVPYATFCVECQSGEDSKKKVI